MPKRRRATRPNREQPEASGREKFSTYVDPIVVAGIRGLAKRKKAQICEVTELALQRYLLEDTAERTDATLAPLISRVVEGQLKTMEGGLRTMIARLAHENLTHMYVFLNFLVEASIPASKVEKWRADGYKFAYQEYRRRRPELEEPPKDEGR